MEFLTLNLVGKIRKAKLQGRDYLVAPLSMIVPGVLNGSKGALYYPPEEIAKNPTAWNGMPIVVYHPTRGSNHVSARDPEIAEQSQIGTVFNAQVDGRNRLKAEGWFDVERTRQVDARILTNLERNKPIELSTGLFTENEPAKAGAVFNGKPYEFIARNYAPDHLAVLPDQVGACSLKDGCGVLVNKTLTVNPPNWSVDEDLWAKAKEAVDKEKYDGDSYWAVVATVYKKMGGTIQGKGNKVNNQKRKLKIKIRATENQEDTSNSKGDKDMKAEEKKAIVDQLISNTCCFEEKDRESLMAMNEEVLGKLAKVGTQAKEVEAVFNAAKTAGITVNEMPEALKKAKEKKMMEEEEDMEEVKNKKKPGCNEAAKEEKKPMSTNEWLETAPQEVQAAVRNAMRIEATEKAGLIKTITDNANNPFKKEELEAMSTEQLRPIAKLAQVEAKKDVQTANYLGAATPFTTNANRNDLETLPIPQLDYSVKP